MNPPLATTPNPFLLCALASVRFVAAASVSAQNAVPGVGNRQQVLYVGPGRELSRPSQAARVARDGALLEIVACNSDGNVTPLQAEGQLN